MKNRDKLFALDDNELANAIIELRFMNQTQLKEWLGHEYIPSVRNFIKDRGQSNMISFVFLTDYECTSIDDFKDKYGTTKMPILDKYLVQSFNFINNTYHLKVKERN